MTKDTLAEMCSLNINIDVWLDLYGGWQFDDAGTQNAFTEAKSLLRSASVVLSERIGATGEYLPVGTFTEAERDKEQYLSRHCVGGAKRKRPFGVVTCASCSTKIYRHGPLWARTGGRDYCRACIKDL